MATTRPEEKSVYYKGFTSIRRCLTEITDASLSSLSATAGMILRTGDAAFYSLATFLNPNLNSQNSDEMAPLLVPVKEPSRDDILARRQGDRPETGFQG